MVNDAHLLNDCRFPAVSGACSQRGELHSCFHGVVVGGKPKSRTLISLSRFFLSSRSNRSISLLFWFSLSWSTRLIFGFPLPRRRIAGAILARRGVGLSESWNALFDLRSCGGCSIKLSGDGVKGRALESRRLRQADPSPVFLAPHTRVYERQRGRKGYGGYGFGFARERSRVIEREREKPKGGKYTRPAKIVFNKRSGCLLALPAYHAVGAVRVWCAHREQIPSTRLRQPCTVSEYEYRNKKIPQRH
jgi:hypothetical protein